MKMDIGPHPAPVEVRPGPPEIAPVREDQPLQESHPFLIPDVLIQVDKDGSLRQIKPEPFPNIQGIRARQGRPNSGKPAPESHIQLLPDIL